VTLRLRILGGVGAIVIGALAIAFVAVYRGTGAALQHGVDRDIRADMRVFAHAVPRDRARLAALRRYVANQPFHATARLLFARLRDGETITNQPELLATAGPDNDETVARQRTEDTAARNALRSPEGLSTVSLPDAGRLRLLVRVVHGTRLGVAEPLRSVTRAQAGTAHAFVLAGVLALAAALAGGLALADRVRRPLRRMAAVAVRVDAGDLAPRMAVEGPRDEVGRLADAFNHMLDRLQDSFDRQTAFVADASHELRTPLTVIRGQLEVLARQAEPAPGDVRRVERVVSAEVGRMSRMVDDLLVLAAPQVRLRPVALAPFLRELTEAAATTAPRRFTIAQGVTGTLQADPDRLAQAVRNLLRNAVEHTVEGGRIELGAVAAGDWVTLLVDDDGPGIPPAERERVFDRFHRSDGSAPRRGEGSGLGLAIVKAIADAHGGRAWADASPLGGARVAIALPRFAAG
jgi:signal transduction histidine kinase